MKNFINKIKFLLLLCFIVLVSVCVAVAIEIESDEQTSIDGTTTYIKNNKDNLCYVKHLGSNRICVPCENIKHRFENGN